MESVIESVNEENVEYFKLLFIYVNYICGLKAIVSITNYKENAPVENKIEILSQLLEQTITKIGMESFVQKTWAFEDEINSLDKNIYKLKSTSMAMLREKLANRSLNNFTKTKKLILVDRNGKKFKKKDYLESLRIYVEFVCETKSNDKLEENETNKLQKESIYDQIHQYCFQLNIHAKKIGEKAFTVKFQKFNEIIQKQDIELFSQKPFNGYICKADTLYKICLLMKLHNLEMQEHLLFNEQTGFDSNMIN